MTRRQYLAALVLAAAVGVVPEVEAAQRRRRRPARVRITVHRGHPIRRRLPATVVIRAPRRPVVVSGPVVFLAPVAWRATVVTLPPAAGLVWQDSETIERDEEWVDCNFGVDATGKALFLGIAGPAQLNFAEITFHNNETQVVDFEDRVHGNGIYELLDFANGRRVMTVRLLAQARGEQSKLTVYMAK